MNAGTLPKSSHEYAASCDNGGIMVMSNRANDKPNNELRVIFALSPIFSYILLIRGYKILMIRTVFINAL